MLNENNYADIFGFGEEDYLPNHRLGKKFGRNSTFDEDILALVKKFKGKPQEVLVRHMIDSLILFNHNRGQAEDVNTSDKFGNVKVWKAIQLQLNS